MTNVTLLRDARVFNGTDAGLIAGDVRIEDARIVAVGPGDGGASTPDASVIDVGGRVVMPGLIDAHAHIIGMATDMPSLFTSNMGLIYARAYAETERILLRGFTTVRDMGGDVIGVRQAIDAGLMNGPRIYPSRAMVSQTGGHADFGFPYEPTGSLGGPMSRPESIGFTRVADGPERVLAAVREQLKLGATQIKLTAGGGVQSFYDSIVSQQYTEDELRAAVDAATDWDTYVSVHVYNSAGVQRALRAGVQAIEHGHLADEDTVKMIADHGAWLSTQPWAEHDHTYPDAARAAKNHEVSAGVDRIYEWSQKYGVKTAYGTDLLFEPEHNDRQITMFPRLAQYMSPVEALRMATSGNAELLRLAGDRDPYKDAPLGVVAPGAWADLLVVDGDPTADLSLFNDFQQNIRLVMRGGLIAKNTLDAVSRNVTA